MSYSVRRKSQRDIVKEFAGKGESFGNALAQYLNSLKAEVVGFAMDGGVVTIVLKGEPAKPKDK